MSDDVEFRNLGLLIVDEEQRFGVAQKEKIKRLCGNIDVLTLTATPIPRTLNMAMEGIRDISVLDEAPGDRLPVQTYVFEYDELIITEAVRRELRRGGQVFYLHNTVEDIDSVAANLRRALPEAEIVTAHGKMEKSQLEDIWGRMLLGKIDVLVSTTIIETGVDVPNANTLIVDNSHRLGLSQAPPDTRPRRALLPQGLCLFYLPRKTLRSLKSPRSGLKRSANMQSSARDSGLPCATGTAGPGTCWEPSGTAT